MNLSDEQYKEIASYFDLKDVGFFINENLCNFKLWLLAEDGQQVIIIPTEIKKHKDKKLNMWVYC